MTTLLRIPEIIVLSVQTSARWENKVHYSGKYAPNVVINTSALSVPDYCEAHHEEADSINVNAVGQLAFRCEASAARLIHLSTDFVFNGDTMQLYTEVDTPDPVNYYGVTKLKGEKRAAELCSNYAIARVAVVYGAVLPGQHGNVLQLVADRLRNNEEIRVVSDQWRTATYVGDVSQGIEKLINYPNNGIFHICGSECLTIADIAYRVADIPEPGLFLNSASHHQANGRGNSPPPFQWIEHRKSTQGN